MEAVGATRTTSGLWSSVRRRVSVSFDISQIQTHRRVVLIRILDIGAILLGEAQVILLFMT